MCGSGGLWGLGIVQPAGQIKVNPVLTCGWGKMDRTGGDLSIKAKPQKNDVFTQHSEGK